MKDVSQFERSLQGLVEAARRLEAAAVQSEKGVVENGGYVKGILKAKELAEQESLRIDKRLEDKEITPEVYKELKRQQARTAVLLQNHATEYAENIKRVAGRAEGVRFALEIVTKLGEEEYRAIEAKKLSPDVNEKVKGANEMREHLKKSREAAEKRVQEAAGITPTQVNAFIGKKGLKELRDEARNLGVSVSGTKQDIARRVLIFKATKTNGKAPNASPQPNGA